jgi:hypothetical protein
VSGFEDPYARKFNSWIIVSCDKKDSSLCSVLYINDCPFSFGHCIACPCASVGIFKHLMQKRVCNFTWLDHIVWKNMCIIFNLVQFSLKNACKTLHRELSFLSQETKISNLPSNFYNKFLLENCRAGLMIFYIFQVNLFLNYCDRRKIIWMVKAPDITMQRYLFEGLLFKESIPRIRSNNSTVELSCIRFFETGHLLYTKLHGRGRDTYSCQWQCKIAHVFFCFLILHLGLM